MGPSKGLRIVWWSTKVVHAMPVLPMPSPYKHPKTGVYWLRLRVPADLQAAVGKKEIKRSLKTKDPAAAKARFPAVYGQLQDEWRRLREGPVTLSPREISGLAGEHYRKAVAQGGQAHDASVWATLAEAPERGSKGPAAAARWWGPTADELAAKAGLLPDEDSRWRLALSLYEADLKVAEVNRRAAEGDFSPDPNLARFAPMPAKAQPGVTLTALRELWEREHAATGGAAKTVTDWKRIADAFTAHLGHDDAERVTPKDVSDFADHLRHDRGLKAKTINSRYLAALGSLYRLGIAKHVIKVNPVQGTEVAPERVVKVRSKGFTDDEAKAILKAALLTDDPAKRWLPWLEAYTGCRVGELVQLRREDFQTEGGVPYFRVTPEAGSVKTGEFRPVPLHPHLVELGLLDFVREVKAGAIFKPGDAKVVGRFVRGVLKLPEGRTVAPNHAWRHRLKTVARELGLDRAAIDALQGHADGSASGAYGEWTVAALYREVVKLPRYET